MTSPLNALIGALRQGNDADAERIMAEAPALADEFAVALMRGDCTRVQAVVAEDAQAVNRPCGPLNWPPLVYVTNSRYGGDAMQPNRVAVATALLDAGADANAFYLLDAENPQSKLSALYGAAGETNQPALVRLLLERGADPDDGESVYHAAEHFFEACLNILHEFGANLSGPLEPWSNTPLYFLLRCESADSSKTAPIRAGVRWLLAHGADPNARSYEVQEAPLHQVAKTWDAEMAACFIEFGADIDAKRRDGKTPLHVAIVYGNTSVETELRNRKAALPVLTNAESLLAACWRADGPAVRALLDATPGLVASMSEEERGHVAIAADRGKTEVVKWMLEAGFPLDARGLSGGTPLHLAAWRGHLETVETILKYGPPLDDNGDFFGCTPIGWAAHGSVNSDHPDRPYLAIVERLIAAGARLDVPGNRWGSPLVSLGTPAIADLLRRHGASDAIDTPPASE